MASSNNESSPLYKDPLQIINRRVSDLLSRMSLAEKAGQLFHTMITMGPDGTLAGPNPYLHTRDTKEMITEQFISHFNLVGPIVDPSDAAKFNNALQACARETRMGIPITLSTDPRNHFSEHLGTRFKAGAMSLWPEPLGFAATRDISLVERFADIARQEYLAMGLRQALHPQIDLCTEYRWIRTNATFGEDAHLTGEIVQAYIRGFQGPKDTGEVRSQSVSTMAKHFPGGGPQMNGEDSHFEYGREQVYPGKQIDYHLEPFKKAIQAGVREIMPYYSMPVGTEWEEVGFAFNKSVITDLLRHELGFDGVVCTDWGLLSDVTLLGQEMPARAWGCEHLTNLGKAYRVLEAGCDQFGGECCPEVILALVEKNLIPESRIDESVKRILRDKFTLGLFDTPFVDIDAAGQIVGQPLWQQEGELAQRRCYTLLENKANILPLPRKLSDKRIYIEGIDPVVVQTRGLKVSPSIEGADIALLRLRCPYENRPGGFEKLFHAGPLEYSAEEKERQADIFRKCPATIVDMYLDRPAVMPEIIRQADAVFASFGSSDDAFLDVVFGMAQPEGKLPFDLPSSMRAVANSRENVPFDTEDPLFKFGFGLRYTR
ncbi:uncharacterized protein N7496_003088 [Penicillium cataractarum]|uniref:beta-glucosidase n=1 Tax=Penicillium cataractarum TaxID=2100454 RepID=A0A9W9SLM8_9EURO|nr:uncharacterized protein N7496_003088 [Penicillium cataractarum]KAJ5380660.1 hypothetical protein N7496_003088 [Penicillium cataractarum]